MGRKLQPGDRVVYTCRSFHTGNYLRHGSVIERRNSSGVSVQFDGMPEPSYNDWFYDSRFTLEAEYDSPLMEALRC